MVDQSVPLNEWQSLGVVWVASPTVTVTSAGGDQFHRVSLEKPATSEASQSVRAMLFQPSP